MDGLDHLMESNKGWDSGVCKIYIKKLMGIFKNLGGVLCKIYIKLKKN